MPAILQIALAAQAERQLQPLRHPSWQVRELQERDPLVVLVEAAAVLEPLSARRAAPPVGDRREGLGVRIVHVGPQIEADRRVDVNPGQATVGKPGRWRRHRLSSREVDVVGRHGKLTGADPDLEQARIDVHQRGASKAGQEGGVCLVVEVEQEVGFPEHLLGLGSGPAEILPQLPAVRATARPVQDDAGVDAVLGHELSEIGGPLPVSLGVAGPRGALQPVDLAADASQALNELHVGPEVPTKTAVHDIERGHHDRRPRRAQGHQ